MTFDTQVAELVAAAESAVDQCLISVPTGPLSMLAQACTELENAETANDDHPIWALAAVCEDAAWSFWPEGAFGSRESLVDPYWLERVAEALETYREATGQ